MRPSSVSNTSVLKALLVACFALLLHARDVEAQAPIHAFPGSRVTIKIMPGFTAPPGSTMIGHPDGIVVLVAPGGGFEAEYATFKSKESQTSLGLRDFKLEERPLDTVRRVFGVGFGAEPSGDYRKHILLIGDARNTYAVFAMIATSKYDIDPPGYDARMLELLQSVRLSETEVVLKKAFTLTLPPGGFAPVGAPNGQMQMFSGSDGRMIVIVQLGPAIDKDALENAGNRSFNGAVNNIGIDANFQKGRTGTSGNWNFYERNFSGTAKSGQTSYGLARIQANAAKTYVAILMQPTALTEAQTLAMQRSIETIKEPTP